MNVLMIQEQIKQIQANIGKLMRKEIPEISQFKQKADEIVAERHNSIAKYKECEIAAANKLYDGMIYGIESDYENSLGKIHDHIQQFILFKKQQLCQDFPEPAQYFETQTENSTFLQVTNSLSQSLGFSDNDNSDEIEVLLDQGNLISKSEVDQRYEELQTSEIYKIDQGILFKDEEPFLSVGDNVSLHFKESRCYNGIINQIHNFIELDVSGIPIKISVSALNIGIATLSPN